MEKEVRWERMFPDQLEAAFNECPAVYFTYGLCEQQEITERQPVTFQEVEQIWTETVSPALKTFETMKTPEESPPEDSQWFRQCKLPDIRR